MAEQELALVDGKHTYTGPPPLTEKLINRFSATPVLRALYLF